MLEVSLENIVRTWIYNKHHDSPVGKADAATPIRILRLDAHAELPVKLDIALETVDAHLCLS